MAPAFGLLRKPVMMMPKTAGKPERIGALILAGGLATRMQGQDKGLVLFQNQPLVGHLLPIVQPHCCWLGVSANRNQQIYQVITQANTVFADAPEYAQQGPLAGLASAQSHLPDLDWLLVLPCDTPKLPSDLISRFLMAAAQQPDTPAWYAQTDHGPQPSIMLLRPHVLSSLPDYLARGERTLRGFLHQHHAQSLYFSETTAFANGNCQQDLDSMNFQE